MIQERKTNCVCASNRQKSGRRAGVIGIAVNALLFAGKFTVGLLSNSVSVLADGFNNLGDCAASLMTTIGFHLSGKTSDEKHPYGYGRMEYICGLMVTILIIITALSVGKTSVLHMLNPEPLSITPWLLAVQISAIVIKLIFALYIHSVNRKLYSAALYASFKDSLADAAVTAVTLVSLFAAQFTTLPVDGITGLMVAVMILWAGISSFKEHLDLLLGKAVSGDLFETISGTVNRYDVFSGMKEFYLYDFGPEKQVAFLQVTPKVSPHFDRVQAAVKELTAELKQDYHLDVTIYWDTSHIENDIERKKDNNGNSHHIQRKLSEDHSAN